MVIKGRRKQHKGEGQEGGWTLNTVMRIQCITNSKYTIKISTQNYRKVAMLESLHPRKVTPAM